MEIVLQVLQGLLAWFGFIITVGAVGFAWGYGLIKGKGAAYKEARAELFDITKD